MDKKSDDALVPASTVTVSDNMEKNGQVVLLKSWREAVGLKIGDVLEFFRPNSTDLLIRKRNLSKERRKIEH